MENNEITFLIRKAIFNVYNELGPGLLESVYVRVLLYELENLGLKISSQVPVSISYKDLKIDNGYRIDILVENRIILEIKSVEELAKVHHKQILTYLKLTGLELGILVNFNTDQIDKNIFRKINSK